MTAGGGVVVGGVTWRGGDLRVDEVGETLDVL